MLFASDPGSSEDGSVSESDVGGVGERVVGIELDWNESVSKDLESDGFGCCEDLRSDGTWRRVT